VRAGWIKIGKAGGSRIKMDRDQRIRIEKDSARRYCPTSLLMPLPLLRPCLQRRLAPI